MSAIENETMVEAVAREMARAAGRDPDGKFVGYMPVWEVYRDAARAAIRALAPLIIERCAEVADLPKKGEPIEVPDGVFERIAHADAMFDRRDWMAMGKADRDRYVARVKATLGVVISVFIETRMLGDAPAAIRALIQKEASDA